jgi:hypothetical protein
LHSFEAGLAGRLRASLGLALGLRATTGRNTDPPAARLHAGISGSVPIALDLAQRAGRRVGAELHESAAEAAARVMIGRLHPALTRIVVRTDRPVRTLRTGVTLWRRRRRTGGLPKRRSSQAGQYRGRPCNGGSRPDSPEHPPPRDAILRDLAVRLVGTQIPPFLGSRRSNSGQACSQAGLCASSTDRSPLLKCREFHYGRGGVLL